MIADTTTVYRVYDDAGTLLYVGTARNPRQRISQHKSSKNWWPQVASVSLAEHPTRDEALRAEAVAILTEDPRYNRVRTFRDAIDIRYGTQDATDPENDLELSRPGTYCHADEVRKLPTLAERARAVRLYFDAEQEMRRLRDDVIRELRADGASSEATARIVGVSVATVRIVGRARTAAPPTAE